MSTYLSTLPPSARIDFEHFDAGLVGPAVQRAPQAQMPAEIEANRLASLEPTIRTVDVLQFCSWSA